MEQIIQILAEGEKGSGTVAFGCTRYSIAESFVDKLRDGCLNLHLFRNIEEAKEVIQNYINFYNRERPYSRLHYKMPIEFKRSIAII